MKRVITVTQLPLPLVVSFITPGIKCTAKVLKSVKKCQIVKKEIIRRLFKLQDGGPDYG